jgi:hypothetical protein
MKKLNHEEVLDFVKGIIDKKAQETKDTAGIPDVNPSFVINFNDEVYKPMILSFEAKEERESIMETAIVAGFALGVANKHFGLPKPACISLVGAAETWIVDDEDEDDKPVLEGYSVTATTLFADGNRAFNAKNINNAWDPEKGMVGVISDVNTCTYDETYDEDSITNSYNEGLPIDVFWENYNVAQNTLETADKELRDQMITHAKEAFGKILTGLLAGQDLKPHNVF